MGFSARQTQALKRDLDHRHVRKREAHGRELSYLEGWYVVSEANRIFGYDGWWRETLESKCVLARENRGNFLAVYIARVRITVDARGAAVVREGHGSGEGRGNSPGEAHDVAVKAAETDATKRALCTFGKPFGLELYRNASKAAPAEKTSSSQALDTVEGRTGFHPDDTTPIPRPSTYYGRRHSTPVDAEFARERRQAAKTAAPPLVPATTSDFPSGRIDKSVLPLGEPKRIRDRAHLQFVASQPCLVCGRQPCDPHHLRFAQPRAIGLKVSDEFTVPLCRVHHRQLHQAGNEVQWWEKLAMKPLETARQLWQQTHPQLAVTNEKAGGEAPEG